MSLWIMMSVEKDISLLKYALNKKGVKSRYFIGRKGDADDLSERFCLVENNNDTWSVYYSEHGNKNSLVNFENHRDAFKYFYCKVLEITLPTPWDFREEWEQGNLRSE